MKSNSQTIIDKYDVAVANGVYSSSEVDTIVADLKSMQAASLRKRKFLLSACVVVASLCAIDRGMMRMNEVKITQLPDANSDHPDVRKLQSEDPFDNWVECEGIATVPEIDIGLMNDPNAVAYICKPKESSYNCAPSAPVNEGTSPPTMAPVTDAPTESPTTGEVCYNNFDFALSGDPSKNCVWVEQFYTTDLEKFSQLCSSPAVRAGCPAVCGVCCTDPPASETFFTPFGTINCPFLAERYTRLCGNPVFKTNCPETCDNCDGRPFTALTDSPTAAPADPETLEPTPPLTAAPTDVPTESPISMHSASPTKEATDSPTVSPTASPTVSPTSSPSTAPTKEPTDNPTGAPKTPPTDAPVVPPTSSQPVPTASSKSPTESSKSPSGSNKSPTSTSNAPTSSPTVSPIVSR